MGAVGIAPSTTTLTLPDGSTIALADWIDDKLFGSAQLANGQTTPLEIYISGRSQPIPGGQRPQTRVDTNIPRNGDSGLPKDWEMLVYGWGLMVTRVMRPADGQTQPVLPDTAPALPLGSYSDPTNLRTLFNIDRVTFFQFEYNGKFYSQGVFQDYPAGHGYWGWTTATALDYAGNGVPSPRDRVALVLPVHMRENNGYKGVLQPEAAIVINQAATDNPDLPLQFADVKLYSYGLIKRTVV
jgi:hypothetical protein